MTDATSEPTTAAIERGNLPPPSVDQTDWFLQKLVQFANDAGIETGVTLQVAGLLVSGSVMPITKYFEEFAALYEGAFKKDPELGAEFGKVILSYKKALEVPQEEVLTAPPPQYIHLRNAKFFAPGGQPLPSNNPVLWRGRVTDVSGFFLGVLSAT